MIWAHIPWYVLQRIGEIYQYKHGTAYNSKHHFLLAQPTACTWYARSHFLYYPTPNAHIATLSNLSLHAPIIQYSYYMYVHLNKEDISQSLFSKASPPKPLLQNPYSKASPLKPLLLARPLNTLIQDFFFAMSLHCISKASPVSMYNKLIYIFVSVVAKQVVLL